MEGSFNAVRENACPGVRATSMDTDGRETSPLLPSPNKTQSPLRLLISGNSMKSIEEV